MSEAARPRSPHAAADKAPASGAAGGACGCWHVLPEREEGDGRADVQQAARTAAVQPIQGHVEWCAGAGIDGPTKPLPALSGREHQRFDGACRLVCGCVPFRVDVYPEDASVAATDAVVDAASPASPSSMARRRSGAVLSVLLVQSKKKNEWIWPKGGHEQFESSVEAGCRETLEEAGVEGVVLRALPCVQFHSKKGRASRLQPFLLQVTRAHAQWAEDATRRRKWVTLDEVDAALGRAETRSVWATARKALEQLGAIDAQGRAHFLPPPDDARAKELRQRAVEAATKAEAEVASCTTVQEQDACCKLKA